MIELIEIKITFNLPEWILEKKWWWTERIYYGGSHVWAGQVKEDKYRNYILDRIGMMEGLTEYCDHPWGPWVTFEIPNASPPVIHNYKERLENLLKEFKNGKNASA